MFSIRNSKRTAYRCPFFVALFLASTATLFSQYEINPEHTNIYRQITALENKAAKTNISKLTLNNGFDILLRNFNLAVQIAAEENHELYKQSKNELSSNIKLLEALPNNSPYHNLIKAEMTLQWAFVRLYMGDRLEGVLNLREAYKTLEEINQTYPNFKDYKKSLGLLYILIDLIPKEYQWAPEMIGLEGHIEKGLTYLDECVKSKSFFAREALVYKTIVEAYSLRQEEKALSELNNSTLFEETNLLTQFIKANLLYKNRRNNEALNILKNLEITEKHSRFNTLTFIKAESFLFKGDYKTASIYFKQFLKNQTGKNYIKSTYLKLYFCDILLGIPVDKNKVIKDIKNSGQALIELDKYAQNYFQDHVDENKDLLRARFLYDGGYYLETLKTLSGKLFTTHELPEYHYRLAKAQHELKNYKEATTNYNKCIQLPSKTSHEYFAPNSCLYLGFLCEDIKKPELALKFYQQTLEYKNYEYEASIRAKAMARIEVLTQ